MDLPIPYEVNREKNYDGDGDGDGDGNENVKKTTGFNEQNNNSARAFLYCPCTTMT